MVSDFGNLKPLYKHLENNALDYKFPSQIADLFQKIRDVKHKEGEPNDVEIAQWEVDFFNFVLKDNGISPMLSGTDNDGEPFEYPTLDRFRDNTYEYLVMRAENTSNPVLKARYSHILWASPKKHTKFAKSAVDSYLELAKAYEEKDGQRPQSNFGMDVLVSIKNAHALANQIDYRMSDVKSEMIRLMKEFNLSSSSCFALRSGLIALMLSANKNFNAEEFQGLTGACLEISKLLIIDENYHSAIDMLEFGEKIDKRIGRQSHEWRKGIAELYEKLMIQAEQRQDNAARTFCQKAIENFKKIDAKEKIEELEKKYSQSTGAIQLSTFKRTLDMQRHIQHCRDTAKKVAQKDTEDIIRILAVDRELLPRFGDMDRFAAEQSEQTVFLHDIPVEVMDQSGHTAQSFVKDDERKYFHVLQNFQRHLEVDKIHLIREIFFAAIREKKLCAKNLINFLEKNSWIGEKISKSLPNNQVIEYCWLDIVSPSLIEFFHQVETFLADDSKLPNLVLSIDSLTLKIEGLIRDVCRLNNVTTFYMLNDRNGVNIAREKDIHALLYEPIVKELFGEDDLLFFRFLLVEKAGYNLRHSIAHSLLLLPQEYSIDLMHLLILVLLRLGKYDFVK